MAEAARPALDLAPGRDPGARREALRGHGAMLAFSALIAGSFSLGGLAANEIAPAALNAVRFVLAAGLLLGMATVTGRFRASALAAPWRWLVLGGLFAFYFVTMFEGLKTAPPVSSAAVFTLTPILSGMFGYLLLRQRTSPRAALALAIGGAGALWVIFRADLAALLAFRVGPGEAIFFWGCVGHALYTPLARLLNRGEPPMVQTGLTLGAGLLLLLAYGAGDITATDWGNLPVIVWITILYTAIFAGATTVTLLQYAAMRLPSAKVMAYTYLTPAWVILWELALGQGAPPLLILPGVALTAVALGLLLKDD
jgi:drug/metabolite transporter (DMT)-like permease